MEPRKEPKPVPVFKRETPSLEDELQDDLVQLHGVAKDTVRVKFNKMIEEAQAAKGKPNEREVVKRKIAEAERLIKELENLFDPRLN